MWSRCGPSTSDDGFPHALALTPSLSPSHSLWFHVYKRPTMGCLSLPSLPVPHALSLSCSLNVLLSRSLARSLSRSLSCCVHKRPTIGSFSGSFSFSLPVSHTPSLSRSLALSLSVVLWTTNVRRWVQSICHFHSLSFTLSFSVVSCPQTTNDGFLLSLSFPRAQLRGDREKKGDRENEGVCRCGVDVDHKHPTTGSLMLLFSLLLLHPLILCGVVSTND